MSRKTNCSKNFKPRLSHKICREKKLGIISPFFFVNMYINFPCVLVFFFVQIFVPWKEILVSLALLIATELVDFWFLYHCFVLIQKDKSKRSENQKQTFQIPHKFFLFRWKIKKKMIMFYAKITSNLHLVVSQWKSECHKNCLVVIFFWKKMLNFRNEKLSKKTEIFLTSWNVLDAFFIWIRKFTYDLNVVNLVFIFSFEKFSEKKDRFFKKNSCFGSLL